MSHTVIQKHAMNAIYQFITVDSAFAPFVQTANEILTIEYKLLPAGTFQWNDKTRGAMQSWF